MATDLRQLETRLAKLEEESRMNRRAARGKIVRIPAGGGGGGRKKIKFTLDAELGRGDTAAATHVPWADERVITELEVFEGGVLSASLTAPAGTVGYADKVGNNLYVVTHLDCDALESE